jgi:predicted KAP-like P-loop ATPase
MTTNEDSSRLSPDRPLSDPGQDQLGYAPFAKNLAESICKMAPPEGLVIAIYGPWGAGKTTVLEFVNHYIEEKEDQEQPIVVRFNPWWFSGHADVVFSLFRLLQVELESKLERVTKDWPKYMMFLGKLASGIPYAGKSIEKMFDKIPDLLQKSVPELKQEIAKELKEEGKRILVIIDDIDRLTVEEIRQLFRAIRAVADFPNTVYLLAFDQNVVVKALGELQGISGQDYLEKIVQVPFELPLPNRFSLSSMFSQKLDAILTNTPGELFDEVHWGNIFQDGIRHFISTPRDVTRLSNTLSVTYPAVQGEVNAVEFISNEPLRVFRPTVYEVIRRNGEAFAGISEDSIYGFRQSEHLKEFHDSWINSLSEPDVEIIKKILQRLFPKLESVWGNMNYRPDWLSRWRKERRICSPDVFPCYFNWTIPENTIARSEIKAVLEHVNDSQEFGVTLLEFADQKLPRGTSRVRALLEQLEDYTETEIPAEGIFPVIRAFFDVGDELVLSEEEAPFDFLSISIRIDRITWQLLRRLDEPERFEILRTVISEGRAIYKITDTIVSLGQQHGKFEAQEADPDPQKIVSAEHLEELEKIVLERIRRLAQGDSLQNVPRLRLVLTVWRELTDKDEVGQWVRSFISDDRNLAALLEKFLFKSSSYSITDAVPRIFYRLDPERFKPYFDPSEILDRVRALTETDWLTEKQRSAAEQFIKEYEIRRQGKDPGVELGHGRP